MIVIKNTNPFTIENIDIIKPSSVWPKFQLLLLGDFGN